MPTLGSLPTEILLKIFSSCLNQDLAKISQVCKFFNYVAQQCIGRTYIFKVDAKTCATWRLVRCLLINAKIGEYFIKVCLEWNRRIIDEGWTKRWEWEQDEIERIKEIGETWSLNPEMISVIIKGANSEALLPFLLCFTPNLQSLDMGNADARLISYDEEDYRRGDFLEEIDALLPENERGRYNEPESPRSFFSGTEDAANYPDNEYWFDGTDSMHKYFDYVRDHYNLKETFDDLEGVHLPDYRHRLWFYENLLSKEWLPGLAKLNNFTLHFKKGEFTFEDLISVFFLPRIKTVRVKSSVKINSSITPKLKDYEDLKSGVERLQISNIQLMIDDYAAMAEFTGKLKKFILVDSRRHIGGIKSKKTIGEAFLSCNPHSLRKQGICIKDEGGETYGGLIVHVGHDDSDANSESNADYDHPHFDAVSDA
ncbi:hypothetical protein ABW20_dc0104735 [Dactylellina cionopaga]|nr:hypothetical protein ABW20_dc0104735 [Dactylellina cionopaga]